MEDVPPSRRLWDEIPEDLLHLISSRLVAHRVGGLRLRSVCSAWRHHSSSSPSSRPDPPFPRLLLPGSGTSRYISKRTVLAFSPSPLGSATWLCKLEDQAFPGKMRRCNPLTGEYLLKPLHSDYAHKVNLLEMEVLELGYEYVFWSYDASFDLPMETVHRDRLAVAFLGNEDSFFVLAIEFPTRFLWLYKVVNGGMHERVPYDETQRFADLIAFQDLFYVVDGHGTTRAIRPESMEVTETLASRPEQCGETKRLVKCGEDLLMVDICSKQACCGPNQQFNIKLFKLNGNRDRWIKVDSIGNQVVFLGDKSSFSAPASAFRGRGNRVVFEWVDSDLLAEEDALGFFKVFDVASRSVEDLKQVPELINLFRPSSSCFYRNL